MSGVNGIIISTGATSCGGLFGLPKPSVLAQYQTEFRKGDSRRAADPFTAAALHFVDIRERRLLAGAHLSRLTPVVGGFTGKRSPQDAHIIHTAYRAFFEKFFGIYVEAEFVEGLVEELELVPAFQHGRKGYVYYVLTLKQLFSIIGYVKRTQEYTPFYERGLPQTEEQLLALRTVGVESRYIAVDGAAEVLEDLKTQQVATLAFIDVDEPRGVSVPFGHGRMFIGVDPFLLDDMESLRSWLNNVRYKLLRALTKVSRKVVRRFQSGRLRAVFALTKSAFALTQRQLRPDSSLALVEKYGELAGSQRALGNGGGWWGKKLNRVAPEPVPTTNTHRPPALTIEIVAEDEREESVCGDCEEGAGACGDGVGRGTGLGAGN